jgi:hypothetical protein
MSSAQWWINSGLAAEAARELVWFVVIVFLGVGFAIWKDMK